MNDLNAEKFTAIAACLREAGTCEELMVEWGRKKFGDVQSQRGKNLVIDIQRRELFQLAEAAERLASGDVHSVLELREPVEDRAPDMGEPAQ